MRSCSQLYLFYKICDRMSPLRVVNLMRRRLISMGVNKGRKFSTEHPEAPDYSKLQPVANYTLFAAGRLNSGILTPEWSIYCDNYHYSVYHIFMSISGVTGIFIGLGIHFLISSHPHITQRRNLKQESATQNSP